MSEAELRILITARNQANAAFRSARREYSGLARSAHSFAREHRRALGIVAGASAAFGLAAVKAASDQEEALNKVREVYGASAGDIEAFAATAATSLGTSRAAALEATGTIGNLLTAMGQTPGEASTMAQSLVQLSADLGSFNNLGTEEVLEKIRAGLVGEVEPLRTLGVQLSAATVEQEAYRLGLAEVGAELTAAQKVQARYSLILEQTQSAQGDFARTSEGAANATKIIRAQIADAAADFGEALLPAVKAVLAVIRGLLERFSALPDPVKQAIGAAVLFAGAVAGITAAIGFLNVAILANPLFLGAALFVGAVAGIAALVNHFNEVAKSEEAARDRLDELNTALDEFEGRAEAVAGVLNTLTVPEIAAMNAELDAQQQALDELTGDYAIAVEVWGKEVADANFRGSEAVRAQQEALDEQRRALTAATIVAQGYSTDIEALGVDLRALEREELAAANAAAEFSDEYESAAGIVTDVDHRVEELRQTFRLTQAAVDASNADPAVNTYGEIGSAAEDARVRAEALRLELEAIAAHNAAQRSAADARAGDTAHHAARQAEALELNNIADAIVEVQEAASGGGSGGGRGRQVASAEATLAAVGATVDEYRALYAAAADGQDVLNILKNEDLQTVENIARVYRTEYSPAATEVFQAQDALNAAKARELDLSRQIASQQAAVAAHQRNVRDIQADITALVERSAFVRQAEEARRQGLTLDRTVAAARLELATQLEAGQITEETYRERLTATRNAQFAEREIIQARLDLGRIDGQQIRDANAARLQGAADALTVAQERLDRLRDEHAEAQAEREAAQTAYEEAFAEIERQVGLRESELALIDLQLDAVKARDAAGLEGLNKQLEAARAISRELDRANALRQQSPAPTSFTGDPSAADQARMLASLGIFAGATGAIVTQPTVALIGEVPEILTPLNQAPGASPLPGTSGGGDGRPIRLEVPLKIDGRVIARAVLPDLQKKVKRGDKAGLV